MLSIRARKAVWNATTKRTSNRGYVKSAKISVTEPIKKPKPAVFMFTGQGSQWVGMGKDLAAEWKEARDVFEEVDESLRITLSRLMFEGSAQELSATEIAQPAILAHGMAILAILKKELGKDPIKASCALIGHSVGEITAFTASEAISLATASKFVHERGMFMQSATPPARDCGMTAFFPLNLTEAETLVNEVEKEFPESVLDIACVNSPKSIVLSGDLDALLCAVELLDSPAVGVRAKSKHLDVSAPFHSRYMASAERQIAKLISKMKMKISTAPVISGYSHKIQRQVPNHLLENFVPLTSGTVNFMGAIEQANNILQTQASPIENPLWIEIGPKPTLTSFASQTIPNISPICISSAKDIRDLLNNKKLAEQLTGSYAKLN